MADDANEDSWLYGTSNPDSTTNDLANDALAAEHEALAAVTGEKPGTLPSFPKEEQQEYADFDDPAQEMEEDEEAGLGTLPDTTDSVLRAPGVDDVMDADNDTGELPDDEEMLDLADGTSAVRKERTGSASDDDDDDDDSDDDINVVIGDIKSAPSTYNIKQRPNLLAGASGADKAKPAAQGGKFSIEDFEGAGTINGVAVHEFSIDSLEEKPWRKPGADITDYFNYGFNEETWRAYCERQKRFRVVESGVGLASLTQNVQQNVGQLGGPPDGPPGLGPPGMHHSHQMGGGGMGDVGGPMHMPPPGMPPPMMQQPRPGMGMGGGMMQRPPRPISTTTGAKENAIQVMTAECREYSRGGGGPMAPTFPPPGAAEEPFFHEPEPFDYGYEPTQESQWGNDNAGWVPTGIKELTPGPGHMQQPPPGMPPQMNVPPPQLRGPPPGMMRLPHNMNMGPPPGLMMGPGNGPPPQMRMGMGPPQRLPMGNNGSNLAPLSQERGGVGYEDERERRRRDKDKQLKKEQLRKDFLDMLKERHELIERHTRWYDIKKKFETDARYRALDSAYREEFFEDYQHQLKEEKRKERDQKELRERDRQREKDPKDVDKDKGKDKDKDKDKERDKERSSSRQNVRSRSRDKSSRRKSKSREKEREKERSSKPSGSSSTTSSSRTDKKKSHRKDKDEEE